MKKPSRKTIVRNLDKIVSQIVKARDGKCIVCGTTQNLTCGHLFSRVAYSTRWDLTNCYAQCLSCNFRHESDPYPMTEAVKKLWERQLKDYREESRSQIASAQLDDIHRKYVTPRKFKDFELLELLEELKEIYAKTGSI